MDLRGSDAGMGSRLLANIHEGMKVYDRENKEVGEVERVYLGEVSEDAAETGAGSASYTPPSEVGENTFVDAIADALGGDEDLPETLRNRLLREGFIRINAAGLFAADRYVVPDQIASVSDEGVFLRINRDDLIKR